MTQNEIIHNYMNLGGKLTSMGALNLCGCMRLASRIHDLRKEGHSIKDRKILVKTINGPKYVSEYSIEKEAWHEARVINKTEANR